MNDLQGETTEEVAEHEKGAVEDHMQIYADTLSGLRNTLNLADDRLLQVSDALFSLCI